MLKIAIDGTFQTEPIAGLRRYFESLLIHLARIDKKNKYLIYYNYFRKRNLQIFRVLQKNFTTKRNPLPQQTFYKLTEFIPINHSLFIGPVDLIHFPNHYSLPISKKTKSIATIHDLSFILNPEFYPDYIYTPLIKETKKTLNRVDKIITISANTKKDIIEIYEVEPERIAVIYNGAEFINLDVDSNLASNKYNLDGPYILSVSTVQPRKNFIRLMKAYKIAKERGLSHKLVIAGRFGWLYEDILEKRTELSLDDDVIFTGMVSDEMLASLYKGADIFIYPSLYEGFGLPPLEASFYGVPVISSNTSSMPEVMGDGALYIDPISSEDIASTFEQLAGDDEIKSQLIKKGYENLKRFSWEKCARETLELYKKIIYNA
jgi:glycosyltransferase involved in cell wall biosynthesis